MNDLKEGFKEAVNRLSGEDRNQVYEMLREICKEIDEHRDDPHYTVTYAHNWMMLMETMFKAFEETKCDWQNEMLN